MSNDGPGADLGAVAAVLGGYIQRRSEQAPAAAALWAEVHRAATGGKMLRPRLVLTAHAALGGGDDDGAVRAAAGMELLHAAFLIHDDVIDRDWTRRGAPNVAATFRRSALESGRDAATAEHYGTSAALIAGDLAIAGAVDLIGTASADPAIARSLADIVAEAVAATAAGELMDVGLASMERGRVEAVLSMYEAKTSIYSFCAPLQAGAVLSGASPDVLHAVRRAGLALGVAFQIADDLLGTFGDETVTGKTVAGDAREGKQTVLTALLAETDPTAAERLRITATDEESFAATYRDVLEGSGARAAAEDLVRVRSEEAQQHLAATPAPLREALADVLDDLRERVS